mgnify:CR=1 FL=1
MFLLAVVISVSRQFIGVFFFVLIVFDKVDWGL